MAGGSGAATRSSSWARARFASALGRTPNSSSSIFHDQSSRPRRSSRTGIEGANMRNVERIVQSQEAPVGTFIVRRALPDRRRHSVGPWVFLDHFGPFRVTPGKDGVGPHPHAGIETVTYLLSGRQQHRDSAGHTGIVAKG